MTREGETKASVSLSHTLEEELLLLKCMHVYVTLFVILRRQVQNLRHKYSIYPLQGFMETEAFPSIYFMNCKYLFCSCRMSISSLQLCVTLTFNPLFFPLSHLFHSVFSYHCSVFSSNTLQVLLKGDSLCIDYGLRGNLNNPKTDSMENTQM